MPPKVDLLNLIPTLARRKRPPEAVLRKSAEEAVKAFRRSCRRTREKSYEAWCRLIHKSCKMPHDHPYLELMEKRRVRPEDPLWILGLIAFGNEPSSIVFQAIHWPDGKTDHPDKLHWKWRKK